MKAVLFQKHGTLEDIEIADIPPPDPGPGECLIRVHAVALNGFDPMVLRGIPGLKTPMPMIPGADFAGEIAALGDGVDATSWRVGDRVSADPSQAGGMMGETLRGACCEYVCIAQQYLLAIPEGVSMTDAAALPTAYGAAYRMMTTRGKVAAGEKVLILGASGGVGTCCVQLARAAGAEVVAVTSSAAKAAQLRDLGADWVIDSSAQDYVSEVRTRFGRPSTREPGGGVDVVVNYTGGDSWAECFRTLGLHGRLLTCGATAGYDPKTDIRYIWSFEFTIIGSNGWEMADLRALMTMVAEGRLTPKIHSIRPIGEFRDALRALMDRQVVGKSIITLL